jgi:glyoxylase-like metal-dependent hydrolase (beta-lactamase superfamily II)/rhodanese-related sulfurtransferase
MRDETVVPLVDDGLGNSAYLVDLGDGRAMAVDASRDLRSLRMAAARRGLRIAVAADTHLHADFVTGALELVASDGAIVLASATGGREYPHQALTDGDEVDLGGLSLRTLATPGHTHEHIAFELLDGPTVLGVFTGGSLLVGGAARTDLVSPERTEELARAQYRSLRRLASLDDEVAVWPTHGAGSFCSAPQQAERTSTIGAEKARNSLLRAQDEDAFVDELLGSLGSFPRYFMRLAEVNRRGPVLVGRSPQLASLDPVAVHRLREGGAELVDVRPVKDFGAGHIPGSLSIPLRPAFATWLGWLVEPDRPLVFVRNVDQDPAEIAWQALKVGYERIAGELAGGLSSWTAEGGTVNGIPLVDAAAVGDRAVLDVRQTGEFTEGHLPGAIHVELGALATGAAEPPAEPPAEPMVVMCGHGERAMTAASLLARSGTRDLAVLVGGAEDWSDVTGRPLRTGG